MLDSCFSFLNTPELFLVETVCSRWRYACLDSGAGGVAALSRPNNRTLTCDANWLSALGKRKIKPERLTQNASDVLIASRQAVNAVGRLPSVTSLSIAQPVSRACTRWSPPF